MKSFFNASGYGRRFLSFILTILIGVLLVIRPRFAISTGARLLGVLLIAVGAATVILRGASRYAGYSSYVSGFAFFLAGLVILTKYRSLLSIFPTVTGLLIVVNGLVNLLRSYDLGRAGARRWLLPALGSLIMVILGMYILIHPFKTIYLVARFAGVVLIYSGLVDLFIRNRH